MNVESETRAITQLRIISTVTAWILDTVDRCSATAAAVKAFDGF